MTEPAINIKNYLLEGGNRLEFMMKEGLQGEGTLGIYYDEKEDVMV